MTTWGVDYSEGLDVSVLNKYQAKFACRYVGYTSPGLPQTKILTPSEAQLLTSNGIAVVSNWEWYNTRPSEGFNAGVWDATQANNAHLACGGSADRPIYFSVDYNTSGQETTGYFQGVASVIGLNRVGAYGSYACIQYLAGANLIKWLWQTYAWSGNAFYPTNHIYQYNNGVLLGDMVVDYDNAFYNDYGQWFVGGGNNFMEKQFDTLWFDPKNAIVVDPSYKSGVYQIVLAGFLAHKYSACYQTSLETPNTDWNNNPIIWVDLSNGCHIEFANGHGTVYDAYSKPLYSGGIA